MLTEDIYVRGLRPQLSLLRIVPYSCDPKPQHPLSHRAGLDRAENLTLALFGRRLNFGMDICYSPPNTAADCQVRLSKQQFNASTGTSLRWRIRWQRWRRRNKYTSGNSASWNQTLSNSEPAFARGGSQSFMQYSVVR